MSAAQHTPGPWVYAREYGPTDLQAEADMAAALHDAVAQARAGHTAPAMGATP